MKKKWWRMLIIIVLLAVLWGIAWYLLGDYSKTESLPKEKSKIECKEELEACFELQRKGYEIICACHS